MFTHLHVHTEYSLLDGMCRIPQLVARAKELGMTSLAITDHGAMYGAIQFYLAAREAGIKPIIGCEMYVARKSRLDRSPGDNYHLILLAKDHRGYQNLLQLVTKAHLEGFYYRPRIDRELLKEFSGGLVGLSACISGEVSKLVLEGRLDEARAAAIWYKEVLGDFYLEIQRHPMPEQERINQVLIPMSRELDIPLVATNDTHYLAQEDAQTHDLLLCVGRNTSVHDEKRFRMPGDFFYLKSPQEMAELFKDIPEALANTERIAEMCNLTLDFGRLHLPEIDLPPGKSPQEFLSDLCREGFAARYPEATPEITERLSYELSVIEKTKFANYFLVVWDIISFAKREKILYGVRGSAAASIVLYSLGITSIDPLKHRLVFERFLNVERKEMPDIDLDFEDERRDAVISYVLGRYGQDHVAQIITFGTLGARAALRDVGRALGMSYNDVDRVARLVPFAPGMTLARALEESAELKSIYLDDQIVRNLVDAARKVEGLSRHASTHAAGVVISKEPLTKYVPLQRVSRDGAEDAVMTQFSMDDVAKIGLLKMDFLGLANLTILSRAVETISRERGVALDLLNLPLDDARTFALLASGETAGVFQLEGAGMRRYIKELRPTTFSDIAAMVALYRPGPMEHIPTFIKAKHGLEPIRYPHPALSPILEETYGVIVYQDQVLFIVRAFAGYSLGEADIFRKAMGKKIPEVMKKERSSFLSRAVKCGYPLEIAEAVFNLIEPFAGYAFNKAHSVSYAMIAYETAYLKANYPAEYMTAFLTAYAENSEKVAGAVSECRRLGIKVLGPDINKSQANFAIEREGGVTAIRFGLAVVKNVGPGAIAPIIVEREKGETYQSVEDLCRRVDLSGLNRRVLESLIKAGTFDSLGNRGRLLQNAESILALAQREQRLKATGQSTMFDLWGEQAAVPTPGLVMEGSDVSLETRLGWEKELTGVYFSEHPFSVLANKGHSADITFCGQIDASLVGETVLVAGMVASVRQLTTKDGRAFASAILEDLDGRVEVMVWAKVYAQTRALWREGAILLVEGKVRLKDDEVQLNCDSVREYHPETEPVSPAVSEVSLPAELPPPPRKRLVINLSQGGDSVSDITRLHKILDTLRAFPGTDEVCLKVTSDSRVTNLKLGSLSVNDSAELREQLKGLVSESELRME